MTTNFQVGLQGLRDALATLRSTDDPLKGGAAVGTAAFWACALDEQLRPVPGYDERRDADEDGSILPGLRLVRNAVTHGAVVAVRPTQGLVFPLVFPLTFQSLVFRPLEDVLDSWVGERQKRADNARQDAIYRQRVAHNRTFVPLGSALHWLERATRVAQDNPDPETQP